MQGKEKKKLAIAPVNLRIIFWQDPLNNRVKPEILEGLVLYIDPEISTFTDVFFSVKSYLIARMFLSQIESKISLNIRNSTDSESLNSPLP